ncbi:uncharacterized protein LOC141913389 [Tubulanus polymorphus]|uniref:uncharacterized protein LOC141913389 n=1 Tax=Tubulanus polymorphus TaxID=672921 RepID=UPI003DA2CEB3
MSLLGDDCYYFYNAQCTKGTACQYRHCREALGSEMVCDQWKMGICDQIRCPFRHADIHTPQPINRNRGEMACFWETQPGGCLRPHCLYKHKNTPSVQQPPSQSGPGRRIVTSNLVQIPLAIPEEPRIPSPPRINPVIVHMGEESSDPESATSSPVKSVRPNKQPIVQQQDNEKQSVEEENLTGKRPENEPVAEEKEQWVDDVEEEHDILDVHADVDPDFLPEPEEAPIEKPVARDSAAVGRNRNRRDRSRSWSPRRRSFSRSLSRSPQRRQTRSRSPYRRSPPYRRFSPMRRGCSPPPRYRRSRSPPFRRDRPRSPLRIPDFRDRPPARVRPLRSPPRGGRPRSRPDIATKPLPEQPQTKQPETAVKEEIVTDPVQRKQLEQKLQSIEKALIEMEAGDVMSLENAVRHKALLSMKERLDQKLGVPKKEPEATKVDKNAKVVAEKKSKAVVAAANQKERIKPAIDGPLEKNRVINLAVVKSPAKRGSKSKKENLETNPVKSLSLAEIRNKKNKKNPASLQIENVGMSIADIRRKKHKPGDVAVVKAQPKGLSLAEIRSRKNRNSRKIEVNDIQKRVLTATKRIAPKVSSSVNQVVVPRRADAPSDENESETENADGLSSSGSQSGSGSSSASGTDAESSSDEGGSSGSGSSSSSGSTSGDSDSNSGSSSSDDEDDENGKEENDENSASTTEHEDLNTAEEVDQVVNEIVNPTKSTTKSPKKPKKSKKTKTKKDLADETTRSNVAESDGSEPTVVVTIKDPPKTTAPQRRRGWRRAAAMKEEVSVAADDDDDDDDVLQKIQRRIIVKRDQQQTQPEEAQLEKVATVAASRNPSAAEKKRADVEKQLKLKRRVTVVDKKLTDNTEPPNAKNIVIKSLAQIKTDKGLNKKDDEKVKSQPQKLERVGVSTAVSDAEQAEKKRLLKRAPIRLYVPPSRKGEALIPGPSIVEAEKPAVTKPAMLFGKPVRATDKPTVEPEPQRAGSPKKPDTKPSTDSERRKDVKIKSFAQIMAEKKLKQQQEQNEPNSSSMFDDFQDDKDTFGVPRDSSTSRMMSSWSSRIKKPKATVNPVKPSDSDLSDYDDNLDLNSDDDTVLPPRPVAPPRRTNATVKAAETVTAIKGRNVNVARKPAEKEVVRPSFMQRMSVSRTTDKSPQKTETRVHSKNSTSTDLPDIVTSASERLTSISPQLSADATRLSVDATRLSAGAPRLSADAHLNPSSSKNSPELQSASAVSVATMHGKVEKVTPDLGVPEKDDSSSGKKRKAEACHEEPSFKKRTSIDDTLNAELELLLGSDAETDFIPTTDQNDDDFLLEIEEMLA